MVFPDLAQEEVAINKNEKSFRVEGIATLEDQAEMNGEMYVPDFILYFCSFARRGSEVKTEVLDPAAEEELSEANLRTKFKTCQVKSKCKTSFTIYNICFLRREDFEDPGVATECTLL